MVELKGGASALKLKRRGALGSGLPGHLRWWIRNPARRIVEIGISFFLWKFGKWSIRILEDSETRMKSSTPFPLAALLGVAVAAVLPAADEKVEEKAKAGEETVNFDVAASDSEEGGEISMFLSAGYASEYVFRGKSFGHGAGEGRAEFVLPIADTASLSVGGKYIGTEDYEEAQGFASLQQAFGVFTAALGYRWYGLDADNRQEVGMLIATTAIGVDWSLGYFYDAELSGHYVEMMGQHTWQMFDHMALRTGAGISAASNYWDGGSGLNHAVFRLDLPVNVRSWCTLTPWVSASIPLDAIDAVEDDTVAGGVSLQLSF